MLTMITLAVVGILILVITTFIKEWLRRKTEKYYVRTKGNADGGDVIYHEDHESLTFYFDRVAQIIYVPSDRKWEEQMPEWARARKTDIVERIKIRMGENWEVKDKTD